MGRNISNGSRGERSAPVRRKVSLGDSFRIVGDNKEEEDGEGEANRLEGTWSTGSGSDAIISGGDLSEEFPTSLVRRSIRENLEEKTKHLTLNKLQFSAQKLYGRDKERAILHNLAFGERGMKLLIFLCGESGAGKTGLAQSIRFNNNNDNEDEILVISGEFGTNAASSKEAPYKGITRAIQCLCERILFLGGAEANNNRTTTIFQVDDLQKQLNSELQDELPLLCLTFPSLQQILGGTTAEHEEEEEEGTVAASSIISSPTNTEEHKNRFCYAFQRLFRIMTSFLPHRLILILDNMEWIDEASLKLVEALLTDTTIPPATRPATTSTPISEIHDGAAATEEEGTPMAAEATPSTEALAPVPTSTVEVAPAGTSACETCLQKKNNLVIIGCYRSDLEPSNNPHLSQFIQHWKDKKSEEIGFRVTEIAVPNLELTHVNEWLQDLLFTDHCSVLELAQLCHAKTNGNSFYLTAFLKMLHEKMLLAFDLGKMKWTWDVAKIEMTAEATDNVAHLLKQSLATCPPQVQEMLQISACLGSSFSERTLTIVWDNWRTNTTQTSKANTDCASISRFALDDCLAVAIEKSLLFRSQDDSTRIVWAHSKVLDAAMNLMVANNDNKVDTGIKSIQLRIGEILATKLNEVELESALFTVANLLNESASWVSTHNNQSVEVAPMELAKLNLRAARKASKLAGFETAARYASKGIESLPQDSWENHCTTTLDLFLMSAEVEGLIGNFDAMDSRCDEILARNLPDKDKARVYYVQMMRLYLAGQLQEAMDHALVCLKKLGCTFPSTKLTKGLASMVGLARIKMEAKSRTSAEVYLLQRMQDPVRIEIMKLLQRLIRFTYLLKDPLFMPVVLRAYRWTLKYGLSDTAADNFASIGIVMACFLYDFETGRIFGEYALALMSKMKTKNMVAKVNCMTYGGYLHFVRPLHSCLRHLQEGYEVGMQMGDFPPAFQSLNLYLQGSFVCGRSLRMLARDCHMCTQQMKQYKQDVFVKFLCASFQTILNLITPGIVDPTIMTGEAMDESTIDFPSKTHQAVFETHKLQLCFMFGSFEEGAKLALSNDPITKGCPGNSLCYSDILFRGLSLFHMARLTKKSQYTKPAKEMLSLVSKWVEKGNPNNKHHQALLEAEMAALHGKQHIARNKYDIAVVLARRQGFVNDAALANERFGEYMLNDVGDIDDATYRLKEAMDLYREWGALAKVEHLQTKHSDLWPIPDNVVTFG